LKKYFEILKKCALFEGITEDSLLRLLPCFGARVESFDKKYTVFAEGSPARYVGIVLSGSVQIVKNDYDGNRSIVLTVGPSGLFGESFACADISEMPVSVIAAEESEIMLIDCHHILHTCSNACGHHQQMIFNLMKNLAIKNLAFHQKIEVTSKRSTREKLLTYLSLQAQRAHAKSFRIPFDRQELADYLEVERSGLSSEIGKLKREGILRCDKNFFELL